MTGKVILLEGLLRNAGYAPAPMGSLGLVLTTTTPLHTFTTAVVPLSTLNRICVLTSRDFFDEALAVKVATWLLSHQNEISLSVAVQLLGSFSCNGYGFSGILVLGPQAHRWFIDRSSTLHSQTLEVFPIYTGEFSGRETPAEVDILRHDVVSSIDWKRTPSPQAQAIISNQTTGVNTGENGFVFLPMRYLIHELQSMKSEVDSVTVRNYLAQECTVSLRQGSFIITSPTHDNHIKVACDDIGPWVQTFLQGG